MNINDLGKEQGSPMDGQNQKASSQEGAASGKNEGGAASPRKKLVAVYRPQNSQQIKNRPAGQKKQAPAQKTAAGEKADAPAQKPQQTVRAAEVSKEASAGRENSRPENGRISQGNRDSQNRDGRGTQGNRDGQRGSYQGSRDGQGGRDGQRSGYQGNRDGRGFQGSRDGQSRDGQRGGYQGNRDGQRGGYQGNRDGQGSRDGQRSGYQGNRDGRGFQGNRDGQNRDGQRGGYQGNRDGQGGRDGQRSGGYQGNRDGRGFQGSRDGQGRDQRGGFSGGRDGQRGGRGQSSSKSAFDTPIQTKPTSNRQNKNAYKNDKYDKRRHDEEEGRLKGGKPAKGAFIMPQKPAKPKEEEVKVITLPDTITIKELADKMKVQPSVIVGKLFKEKGQMVTVNQEVDYDQAEEIAMEFDILCEKEEKIDVIAELLKEDEENEADMVTRPPVVCVMGHVDHGKTSLLDAIRKTNVTAKEAGGITQHIGAYVVEINGQKITFLDTPGHEAFTAMRMRGAQATDIAILVVAADDGVMPQTVEAINHAKAAGVEIIVAVNKIDKPSANVDRVKQEMSEYELVPEDWGGSTIFVPVSAHTHEGIKDLLEMILLTAEVKELKANPNRKARGIVIEAELDKGKGPVATVLVQKGTLKVGQNVAVGACFGKVRAMMDDKGRRVKEAGPSTPVEILGLNDVPNAGEIFVEMDNEKEARAFAETFISEEKNRLIDDTKTKLSLDALFSQIKAGSVKELPIIVKADVQGSVEAVKQSLMKLSNEEVMVKVIHGGVGAVNESDVNLASASNAIIIGFNVRPDATAKSVAEREKVDIRLYKVIYQAIEDVEAAMKGMLDPVFEEKIIGHAVVRQTFKASGVGTIAGAYVLDGQFTRGCSARITRDGQQIFDGALASLKRFKDDVKEVKAGYECGLVFDKFNDIKEDDMIEAYAMVEVPR
mgnify:FL=1